MRGGKIALISAYAPHSGHPFDVRQTFFEDLGDMISNTSVNGLKLVAGDLNARLHRRLPGAEDIVGKFVFRDHRAELLHGSNRDLLMELCAQTNTAIANT